MAIAADYVQVVAEALDASDTIIAVLRASPEVPGGLRFVDMSGAMERAIGCEPGERNGALLGDIAAPEAAATLREIASAVAGGDSWRGELACLDQAKRPVWLGCHVMPADRSGQAAQLYVLVGRDITVRRGEAHTSKTINILLAKAFQTADVPLAIVNADGRFILTNLRLSNMLGLSANGLAGKLAIDFVAPADRAPFLATRRQQNADGKPFEAGIELQSVSGETVPVLLSSAAIDGLDAKRFGIMTLRTHNAMRGAANARAAAPGEAPVTYQVAGRLRFIDLDAVREVFKDRWESVGNRVMDAAEHIIRKRLAAADSVSRNQDQGFTLCFATSTEEEATFRADAIAREIRQHLMGLGEEEGALAMQIVVTRVPVSANSPAAAQIARQLDKMADRGLQAAWAPPPPPRIQWVYRAGSAAPFAAHVSPLPRSATPGSAMLPETSLNQDLAPIHWALTLDKARPLHTLLVDLRFDQFVRRDRTEAFMAACAKLPPAVRPQLNFLLTGLPAGVTTSLMGEVTRRLKPFCGGIGWHMEEWSMPQFGVRSCPLLWTMVDLGGWPGPPVAVPERLMRLAKLLGAYNIKIVARQVVSADAIRALQAAGLHGGVLRDEERAEVGSAYLVG